MTYTQATGADIQQAFEAFHAANPTVYGLLKEQVIKAMQGNRTKLSIKQVIGWIRWEVYLQTEDSAAGKRFKINDAYTSRYARLLIADHPEYEPFIELRELRAA